MTLPSANVQDPSRWVPHGGPEPTLSDRESETTFLDRLRRGEETACEEFVRAQAGRMLAVARRVLHNQEDAQDALQEAFVSAFRALPEFAGQSRLSTWLHRIVVNAALMKLRARTRQREEAIDELLPQFLPDGHHAVPPTEWSLAPDVAHMRQEVRDQVRRAIDRLPESYRTVLMLRDVEELDTVEAAQLLGVTPNAVKIRLHRARQALRTLLAPIFSKRD